MIGLLAPDVDHMFYWRLDRRFVPSELMEAESILRYREDLVRKVKRVGKAYDVVEQTPRVRGLAGLLATLTPAASTSASTATTLTADEVSGGNGQQSQEDCNLKRIVWITQ